jgi:hypothetical protein
VLERSLPVNAAHDARRREGARPLRLRAHGAVIWEAHPRTLDGWHPGLVGRSSTRQRLADRLHEHALGSDRRAGRYSRSKARRSRRAFIRHFWPVLLGLVVLPDLFLPGLWLLPGWVRAFTGGVIVSAGPWLTAGMIVVFSGSSSAWMGYQGEVWTAGELRRLRRRGWRLMNGAFLKQDIDHLALGPVGLLVIETKWAADPWSLDDARDRRRGWAVDQAADNTRAVRRILRNHHSDVPVITVVLLWHPPADDMGPPWHQDGEVTLVDGPSFRQWVDQLTSAIYDPDPVEAAWADLGGYLRRHEQAQQARGEAPPRTAGQVLWTVCQPLLGGVAGVYAAAGLVAVVKGTVGLVVTMIAALAGLGLARIKLMRRVALGWSATISGLLLLGAVIVAVHRA